jgi:hypothetical protein
MMLHVRDCPGDLLPFDVCPFAWCRKSNTCFSPGLVHKTAVLYAWRSRRVIAIGIRWLRNDHRLKKFREVDCSEDKSYCVSIRNPR